MSRKKFPAVKEADQRGAGNTARKEVVTTALAAAIAGRAATHPEGKVRGYLTKKWSHGGNLVQWLFIFVTSLFVNDRLP